MYKTILNRDRMLPVFILALFPYKQKAAGFYQFNLSYIIKQYDAIYENLTFVMETVGSIFFDVWYDK